MRAKTARAGKQSTQRMDCIISNYCRVCPPVVYCPRWVDGVMRRTEE